MIDMSLLVNTVQSIAIGYAAWRGSIDVFADVLLKSMGGEFEQSDLDQLRALLRGPHLRGFLFSRDVRLWVGSDGLVRLVDQQPSSLRAAKLRLAHNPGPTACRYCLMAESPKLPELIPELDHNGHQIAGSMVHENCRNAWRRLRMQVAASETNHE